MRCSKVIANGAGRRRRRGSPSSTGARYRRGASSSCFVTRSSRAACRPSYLRAHRDQLVIKPNDEYGGSGVTLGWETGEKEWDSAIARALSEPSGWVAQERIAIRRETFPVCTDGGIEMRDMLVDFAPY